MAILLTPGITTYRILRSARYEHRVFTCLGSCSTYATNFFFMEINFAIGAFGALGPLAPIRDAGVQSVKNRAVLTPGVDTP